MIIPIMKRAIETIYMMIKAQLSCCHPIIIAKNKKKEFKICKLLNPWPTITVLNYKIKIQEMKPT